MALRASDPREEPPGDSRGDEREAKAAAGSATEPRRHACAYEARRRPERDAATRQRASRGHRRRRGTTVRRHRTCRRSPPPPRYDTRAIASRSARLDSGARCSVYPQRHTRLDRRSVSCDVQCCVLDTGDTGIMGAKTDPGGEGNRAAHTPELPDASARPSDFADKDCRDCYGRGIQRRVVEEKDGQTRNVEGRVFVEVVRLCEVMLCGCVRSEMKRRHRKNRGKK